MAILTKNNRYLDLDLNFAAHPVTGDIVKVKDEKAVIASIGNLIQTNFFERLFNPDLGCDIKQYLFDPIDLITSIKLEDSLRLVISRYEPRASIQELRVTPNFDSERYDISLTLVINNLTDPFTIDFFLERIR